MAYNFTFTDQSPACVYLPDREAANAWVSSWTGSPDSSYDATHTQTNIAQGTSSHVTSTSGASVQINFVGSAVTLYGQGTAGAYTTTMDNGSPVTGSPVGSMLATYGGLDGTVAHTLVLKTTAAQQLSFGYATFTIRSDIAASSVQNTTQAAVSVGANSATTSNTFFTTSGDGFSNQHIDDGYTRIDTNSANAQITFSCSNTSALFIYGTTNYNHGTFSVEIDPPTGASQGARVFNGTSKWFVLDLPVFFETGMDPTQQYQVKMTNLVAGEYMDIHSVAMMNLPKEAVSSSSASGPASKSTSSSPASTSAAAVAQASSGVGKTVGIAVALVGVLAALVLFAFCFRRRKMQERRMKTRMTMDAMVTPFGQPPHSPYASPFVDTPHLKDTPYASSETPISLSNFRPQAEGYPNSNYGDGYPNNAYGGGPYAANTYATSSPAQSARDLRTLGVPGHAARYSELSGSGSDDFNPYADTQSNSGLAYLRDSTYAPSSVGTGSRPQSTNIATTAPTTVAAGPSSSIAGGSQQPYRRPEKGPLPSETASRAVRQEVDAGRVPDEEILPPSYNPTWQSGQ
ncbi:hypothetical protein C8R45DRAFT_1086840 [Mycena sanguinolenta]|nr:hypothetical protein C8R45DRAFT_1086840 [Mycena sanguinolenta]